MSVEQFKAWFEGFAEGIGESPNADQWARILKKVDELEPKPLEKFKPGPVYRGGVIGDTPNVGPNTCTYPVFDQSSQTVVKAG